MHTIEYNVVIKDIIKGTLRQGTRVDMLGRNSKFKNTICEKMGKF